MSKHYAPKSFFRHVPNRLLKQYFKKQSVLDNFDFKLIKTETKIEPLYQAWLELSDEQCNQIEQDFQDINDMATEGTNFL